MTQFFLYCSLCASVKGKVGGRTSSLITDQLLNFVDPELFGMVGSGPGIIVPYPDLTFLTRNSV
jgi:hypothetical protein